MATLYIYADESGTMPLKDSDDGFVAAAIAFWNLPTPISSFNGHQSWVAQKLNDMKAILAVTYVKPYGGYQATLDAKYDEVNKMALTTREKTGRNAHYVGEHGVSKGNLVWLHAISTAVANAAVGGLQFQIIDALNILLDQKTLDSGLRNLLIKKITEQRETVIQATFPSVYPVASLAHTFAVDKIISRVQYTPERIRIYTSDERETNSDRVGLRFADYIAKSAYRALRRDRLSDFFHSWKEHTLTIRCVSVAESLTQDIGQKARSDWINNTGLRMT